MAYIALVLAYYAYRKSVLDKYESWKSLLRSFQQDLSAQKNWFNARYSESYVDKQFINPDKIVYALSFESAKEITRRGIGSLSMISKKLENEIAIFNERVEAFTSLLDYQKRVITADPILSAELREKLRNLELANPNVSVKEFFNRATNLKNSNVTRDVQLYHLANQLLNINRIIHNDLIGDGSKNFHLSYLWSSLNENIATVLRDFEKKIPYYIRCHKSVVAITLIVFIAMTLVFSWIG